jgi:hypothetical protein
MKRSSIFIALPVLSLTAVGVAHAEPPCGPHRPPPEAFSACQSQKQGAACTVNFHGQSVAGTCETFGDEGLACRPEGPPPAPPPRE